MQNKTTCSVVVVGAGASGLVCAIEAGRRGRKVILIDHNNEIGKKIKISGGGRCNFTNLSISPENYISENPKFTTSALARFGPEDFVSLLKKHRIDYYEKENGQLFCSKSSRDVLKLLNDEAMSCNVNLLLSSKIKSVKKDKKYYIETTKGNIEAESLVVATGGLSYSSLGASNYGYELAKEFGLKIVSPKPGLVPLEFSKNDRLRYSILSGVSHRVKINFGKTAFCGDMLFTHMGISGPVVLQMSSYWSQGGMLSVDLMPDIDIEKTLLNKKNEKCRILLPNLLAEYLPKRFAEIWSAANIELKPITSYSEKELKIISKRLHCWEIVPASTSGYDKAEVTCGGVSTLQLSSKTMEVKSVSGLYFVGEVLDVTGHLGGYNLHWAWASGYVAGQYA